jgi:hypothetical protein
LGGAVLVCFCFCFFAIFRRFFCPN